MASVCGSQAKKPEAHVGRAGQPLAAGLGVRVSKSSIVSGRPGRLTWMRHGELAQEGATIAEMVSVAPAAIVRVAAFKTSDLPAAVWRIT